MVAWYQCKKRSPRSSRIGLLIFWTFIPQCLVRPLGWLFYRLRFSGAEKIPDEGPLVLLANHQSHMDPALLGTFNWRRTFRALARTHDNRFWHWVLNTGYDCIWLKRDASDIAAMRAALSELKAGRVSALFPEGRRCDDGALAPFKRGAFLLIRRSMAPVMPVAIEGAHDIWPRGTSFPRLRGRMLVKAGDPIPAQTLVDMGADAAMEFLYDTLEGLRMELRDTIRSRSKGVYPPPGVGDADNRDGHRPKVVN